MDASFWNERYKGDDYAYGRAPNEFVRSEAKRIPKGRVLCLAEGEGRNAVFLATLGYQVTAVDFSTEGLRKTERLAREANVNVATVHADLAAYEPERGVYAGIVSVFAHVPLAIRTHVHRWVPQALQVGGVFVLEAYTPAQIPFNTGGPRDAALLMTLAQLREELQPLAFDVGQEVQREIHEGAFHAGMSATVQVVARRA